MAAVAFEERATGAIKDLWRMYPTVTDRHSDRVCECNLSCIGRQARMLDEADEISLHEVLILGVSSELVRNIR